MKKFVALAGLLVLGGSLGLILMSCGSEDEASPRGPSTPTTSNPYPYTSPIKTEGSSPARLAGDGRYFGSVRAADATSQPPTISFDVAQFFFGKDVQKAAEEDGVVAPGEPVSNDHYARDPDAEVQILKIAKDAQVTSARPVTRLTVPRWAPCEPGRFLRVVREEERLGLTGRRPVLGDDPRRPRRENRRAVLPVERAPGRRGDLE